MVAQLARKVEKILEAIAVAARVFSCANVHSEAGANTEIDVISSLLRSEWDKVKER
jgi:hypothetical protein